MDMRKAPNGSSLSFTGRLWQFDDAAAIRRSDKTMQKNVEMLPKKPIGSLHLEFKKCGRPNCRCTRDLLHGPYFLLP